jgi:hypothetical protein
MYGFPYQNWMGDIADSIKNKRLSEICIPATHNSGAYGLHASDPATAMWGLPWANNQSVPIYSQLLNGIRVLDLRLIYVGKKDDPSPSLKDVLITHTQGGDLPHMTTYLGAPVENEVKAISEFVKDHPKEIVIVWIHKTFRFHPAVHHIVAECLNQQLFQHHMLPSYRTETIGELVRLKRRVIIRYEDQPAELQYRYFWMWTKPNDQWAYNYVGGTNVNNLFTDTSRFLAERAPKRANGDLYYAELQLTESDTDIIKAVASQPLTVAMMGFVAGLVGGPGGALLGAGLGAIAGAIAQPTQLSSTLQLALISNMLSYRWLWLAWAQKANIVAVDYFEQVGLLPAPPLLETVMKINRGETPAAGTITR